MNEFPKFRFPQLSSNQKEVLCLLDQWVFDREAGPMSQERRDQLVKETAKVIRLFTDPQPRLI